MFSYLRKSTSIVRSWEDITSSWISSCMRYPSSDFEQIEGESTAKREFGFLACHLVWLVCTSAFSTVVVVGTCISTMTGADKNSATGEDELKKNQEVQDSNEGDYDDDEEEYSDSEEEEVEEEEEDDDDSSSEEESQNEKELERRRRDALARRAGRRVEGQPGEKKIDPCRDV